MFEHGDRTPRDPRTVEVAALLMLDERTREVHPAGVLGRQLERVRLAPRRGRLAQARPINGAVLAHRPDPQHLRPLERVACPVGRQRYGLVQIRQRARLVADPRVPAPGLPERLRRLQGAIGQDPQRLAEIDVCLAFRIGVAAPDTGAQRLADRLDRRLRLVPPHKTSVLPQQVGWDRREQLSGDRAFAADVGCPLVALVGFREALRRLSDHPAQDVAGRLAGRAVYGLGALAGRLLCLVAGE